MSDQRRFDPVRVATDLAPSMNEQGDERDAELLAAADEHATPATETAAGKLAGTAARNTVGSGAPVENRSSRPRQPTRIGGRSVLRTIADHPDEFRAGVGFHPSYTVTDDDDSPHLAVPAFTG